MKTKSITALVITILASLLTFWVVNPTKVLKKKTARQNKVVRQPLAKDSDNLFV